MQTHMSLMLSTWAWTFATQLSTFSLVKVKGTVSIHIIGLLWQSVELFNIKRTVLLDGMLIVSS